MMAGSILMMLFALFIFVSWLVLFLSALISCLNTQPDKDRTTWVLVIIFVPWLGPILYFFMAKKPSRAPSVADAAPPYLNPSSTVANVVPDPSFDHLAMHDEKKRAAAIAQDLHAMMAAKRRSKP